MNCMYQDGDEVCMQEVCSLIYISWAFVSFWRKSSHDSETIKFNRFPSSKKVSLSKLQSQHGPYAWARRPLAAGLTCSCKYNDILKPRQGRAQEFAEGGSPLSPPPQLQSLPRTKRSRVPAYAYAWTLDQWVGSAHFLFESEGLGHAPRPHLITLLPTCSVSLCANEKKKIKPEKVSSTRLDSFKNFHREYFIGDPPNGSVVKLFLSSEPLGYTEATLQLNSCVHIGWYNSATHRSRKWTCGYLSRTYSSWCFHQPSRRGR